MLAVYHKETRSRVVTADLKINFTPVGVVIQRIAGCKENRSWKKCVLPNLIDIVSKTTGATLIQFSLVAHVLARHEFLHPIKTG